MTTAVQPIPGGWSAPATVDLPAAAGTPQNCGLATSGAIIYVRSTQAFKWVFAANSGAASTAFASTAHGRGDAGILPIPTKGQTSTNSLFIERASGSADTNGLSYWTES